MDRIVAYLKNQKKRLREPGQLQEAGRIAAMVDVALISLCNRLSNRQGRDPQEIRRHGAVLATGELGRRQMGPFSPISLLFLQAPEASFGQDFWLSGMVQPLQEAGWEVEFRIATVEESAGMALSDFHWLAAVIDSRFLSGSRALAERVRPALQTELQKRGTRASLGFFLVEWRQRKTVQQDPAYILEPDLERSAGSLGELNRIRWAAYLFSGKRRLPELGLLEADSVAGLEQAERFLLRVRNQLQLLKERRETRLLYEDQRQVALSLGYRDQGDFLAAELMMRDLENFFYEVNLAAERSRVMLAKWLDDEDREAAQASPRQLAPGIWVKGDELGVDGEQLADCAPENLLELFRLAANERLPLGLEAYQWARNQARRLTPELKPEVQVRAWLFDIFRQETPEARTLRELYDTGILQVVIPELRQVHALVQHDAFHLYPVHEHHLRTFAELKRLLEGEYDATWPQVREWRDNGGQSQEILLLAGLIHDVGKAGGHGHAARGGEIAGRIADRLGLDETEKELLCFLVANHVLLTDSAGRRDVDDQQMLRHCAGSIGSVERLKMLMLHAFADLKATGPRAWEHWQSLPMLALYRSLLQRLEKGDPDERLVAARLQVLRQQVAEMLGHEVEAEELDEQFRQLDSRYLLSVTAAEMVGHLELERQLQKVPIAWQVKGNLDTWELTLLSRQPLGLLARAAGVLTLHELDIRKAQTHTKKNGVAIQIFKITPIELQAEISWERVIGDLEKTLQGKLALEYRLAEQAARVRRKGGELPERPDEVVVDNESSDRYTIIEVYTSDRPGLLYAITRTLFDLQLQILLAKISTRMDQVADIFYVLTQEGSRLEDPEQIEETKRALLFSLQRGRWGVGSQPPELL